MIEEMPSAFQKKCLRRSRRNAFGISSKEFLKETLLFPLETLF